MEWLKGFFRNAEFSGTGSLVRLANPQDNYSKRTEFMNSTLIVKNKELFIKNDDCDYEQEQMSYISFPLNADSQLIHYSISDDDVRIECIKWVDLNAQSQPGTFYGFEFENANFYQGFAAFIAKYLKIEEEGFQDPNYRLKNLKAVQSKLAVTKQIVASDISKTQIKPEVVSQEEVKAKPDLDFKRMALQALSHLYTPDSILFMSPGDLYLLGPGLETPILTDKGVAFLIIRHPEFRISLDLVRESQVVMRILIDNQFHSKVELENRCISWVENVSTTERRTWKTVLLDEVSALEGLISIAKYESEKKIYVSELNEEDQKWVKGVVETESEKEEASGEHENMELDFEEPIPSAPVNEDFEDIKDSITSWRDSRVYASRKGKITIYSDSESGLKQTSMMDLDANPSQMLLQKQDTNLLFLNSKMPNIVYQLDLNRCQIVDEFKVKEDPLRQLCHTSKFSQLTDSSLFLGLSEKALYTIDPRDPKKIVQTFSYSSNPLLSCMSTTEQGHIAAGSDKGEIRLYKEIGKKSTTNFPGLGHAIKSIDSSNNGDWLVATTDNYLMVIQTKYGGELAYTKALARKRKPPRKLVINPDDIARYQILTINFTPAKFNVNESNEETSIITSTGNLVIVWNFASVKSGNVDDYFIKPMEYSVIKNEFKYGDDSVVITYPKTVQVQRSRWNSRKK